MAQKYTKGEKWTIKKANTEELVKESDKKLKNGADPMEFWLRIQYIKKVVYSGTCKAIFEKLDNGVLGLEGIGEKELEDIVRDIVEK